MILGEKGIRILACEKERWDRGAIINNIAQTARQRGLGA